MINESDAPALIKILGLLVILSLPAIALCRETGVPDTRELLALLLTSPAASQPAGGNSECTKASDATTVREDVIYFLAKLSNGGSVTSECAKDAELFSCRLVIGQNTGRREGVWTRTYEVSMKKNGHLTSGKINCFTIP